MFIKISTTIAILFVWFKGVSCLYCLNCNNVPSARDCHYIKQCGSHEVCYAENVVGCSGRIYRRMGCRDVLRCPSGTVVGKRVVKRDDNCDLVMCSECCSAATGFCQTSLCSDKPYESNGPLCFNCASELSGDCNTITQCGRDEVCVVSLAPNRQDNSRQYGCLSKHACDVFKANSPAIGKRQIGSHRHCFNCCDSPLCNLDCAFNNTMAATTTPTPSHGGVTQPACVDKTSPEACRLAASIICMDSTQASNANCMHYCGFC